MLYDLTRAKRFGLPPQLGEVLRELRYQGWPSMVSEDTKSIVNGTTRFPNLAEAQVGLVRVLDWIGRVAHAGYGVRSWTIRVIPGFVRGNFPIRRISVFQIKGFGWDKLTRIWSTMECRRVFQHHWGVDNRLCGTIVEARIHLDEEPEHLENPGCSNPLSSCEVGIRWNGDPDRGGLSGNIDWQRPYTETWWTDRDQERREKERQREIDQCFDGYFVFDSVIWTAPGPENWEGESTCPDPVWRHRRPPSRTNSSGVVSHERARGPPKWHVEERLTRMDAWGSRLSTVNTCTSDLQSPNRGWGCLRFAVRRAGHGFSNPHPSLTHKQTRITGRRMSIDELEERVQGCTDCFLCYSRNNVVFGAGDPAADLMIIGSAPNEDEDAAGRPFVGSPGSLLDAMLDKTGLDRTQVYATNIVKCKTRQGLPSEAELHACWGKLVAQIRMVRPKAILTLGRVAANQMTGRDDMPMGVLRGRDWTIDIEGTEIPVVVAYHPLYVVSNQDGREGEVRKVRRMRAFLERMRRAVEISQGERAPAYPTDVEDMEVSADIPLQADTTPTPNPPDTWE